jgi:hypothetical protein
VPQKLPFRTFVVNFVVNFVEKQAVFDNPERVLGSGRDNPEGFRGAVFDKGLRRRFWGRLYIPWLL